MSRSHRPDHEIPQELQPPPTPAHEAADLFGIVPGQLVELRDGQQVVVLSLVSAGIDAEAHATATVVRVRWPRSGPLPLGVSLTLLSTDDLAQGPLQVLGAWFHEKSVPGPERVVLEAIHRGLITKASCGVPWPLSSTWQLSPQAAAQIERFRRRFGEPAFWFACHAAVPLALSADLLYALQIAFSHWWLARFRYGPMEWLWRGFTYRQVPPLRIAPAAAPAPAAVA